MTHCDMTYHDMAGECITPPTGSRPVHCPSPLLTILPRNFVELTFTRFSKESDCSKYFHSSRWVAKYSNSYVNLREEKHNSTRMLFNTKYPSPLFSWKKKSLILISPLNISSFVPCVCRAVLLFSRSCPRCDLCPCSRCITLFKWNLPTLRIETVSGNP